MRSHRVSAISQAPGTSSSKPPRSQIESSSVLKQALEIQFVSKAFPECRPESRLETQDSDEEHDVVKLQQHSQPRRDARRASQPSFTTSGTSAKAATGSAH